jgi:CDP-paratose 2-epimerase
MVFYISTSKVYNTIGSDALQQLGNRLQPTDEDFQGISERTPTNFALPNVCSRGAADHHVTDYARFYDVSTVVLRADTVAGPRQFEKAGQGWVSHLVYSILAGDSITVYGTGLQVREVLHVSDVVSALMAARGFRAVTSGNVYNIGGGPAHTVSVNEMLALVERICHRKARVLRAPARPEDPLYFMADSSRFMTVTGWFPRRSLEQTVRDIAAFWHAQQTHMRYASRLPKAAPQRRHAA